jgi:anti-sigma factor RsiW
MSEATSVAGWEGTWDGPHLTEETAHAWLDGALTAESTARAAAHVASCADCDALVAEARGLVSAASRVLSALDEVPGGVVPPAWEGARPVSTARRRAWWAGAPARAAAAVLVVAAGSAVVLRNGGQEDSAVLPEAREEVAADAAAPEAAPPLAPASPAPPPAPLPALSSVPVPTPRPAPTVANARKAVSDAPRTDEAASALAAAPAPPAAPPTPVADADGAIRGRVVAPDGRPVAQAQVQAVGLRAGALTDDSGGFALRDLRPGNVTLAAWRVGFAQGSATVAVPRGDTATAAIVLRPAANALEQVVTTGAAIAGGAAREEAERRVRSATPTSPAGCWAVRASGGGWARGAPALPARLRLRASSEARSGVVEPADGASGWAAGRWVAADDQLRLDLPAAGGGAATLTLRPADGGWRGTAAWRGADGATAASDGEVRLAGERCPTP